MRMNRLHGACLPAAAAKALDDPVWEDDSIEIQIAPGNDSGKYYHLIINTAGVLYDASGIAQSFDKSFTSDAEVKVLRNGSVRQYEIRVPLAPMGAKIEPGKVWRMHFMRSVTNLQPPDEREWSSMDGVPPHQVQLFRNAFFSKNHIVNGNFAELSKQKIGGQEVMFPKKWELYGNTKDWKIIKTGKGNEIHTKGVLTTGIPVPKDLEEGSFYNLVIRAKGTGKIGIRTWSWEGHNPRTNHRRVEDLRNTISRTPTKIIRSAFHICRRNIIRFSTSTVMTRRLKTSHALSQSKDNARMTILAGKAL